MWMDVYRQTDRQADSRTDIGYGWMDRRTDIFTSTAYNIQELSNIFGVCVCLCRLHSAVEHEGVWGTGGTAPHILILGTDFVLAARSGCFIQGYIVGRHQTKVRVRHILSGHWT